MRYLAFRADRASGARPREGRCLQNDPPKLNSTRSIAIGQLAPGPLWSPEQYNARVFGYRQHVSLDFALPESIITL